MHYKTVIFDLDGTLTDPGLGITNSVMYALQKFGITETREKLYRFVGPSLRESFANYYGFSESEAEKAVTYYREYYVPHGIYENEVYSGIENLLKALKDNSCTLLVATLKPTVFAVEVLKHFGLDGYFDLISGSELDGSRDDKHAIIAHAFSRCPEADQNASVMVGDRLHDILAAGKAGIDSVGVLYGYGSRDELVGAGAGHIAETVADLSAILTA